MFKKVIFNTGYQIIGKVITASATLIITLLIAKSLGPAGYGDFTKIFVFIGYFYTIADFGLNNIYIKLSHKEKDENLIRYLVGLRIVISIFLAIMAIIISLILPYNPQLGLGFSPFVKIAIAIASLTIITQALLTAANAYFQKNLRYDLSAISAAIGTVVILFSSVIFTLYNPNLLFYTAGYVFGGITIVITSYFLIFNKLKYQILPLFNLKKFIKLSRNSFPVALALIFNLIYFRIDIFILAYTRSTVEVGIYGLAYQFFEASLSIPIFIANTLYPLLSKLYTENISEYKKQVKKWLILAIIASLFLILALFLVSFLIPVLYDARFYESQKALFILALGLPFFFISAILWHLLIIHDKQKYLCLIYLAGAIFNLTLNLIFTPRFGYLSASAITVVSEALITLMLILTIIVTKERQH